jgi:hypothetical protein
VKLALSTALMLALAAAVAPAADSPYQTSTYTLSAKRPASPTAERFKFDYVNPDDPAAKPRAVTRVVTILPRGARYDTSVPGSCTASDEELELQGGAACPPDSAIGGGVVTVDTGAPDPGRIVTADVEFFNNAEDTDGEFIYVNTVRGSTARTVIRADVTKRRTVTNLDMLPGTPPDGGAIDTVDVVVAKVVRTIGGKRRSYIRTPRRCRAGRRWIAKVRFSYGDDYSQLVTTPNPCKRRPR